MVGSNGGVLVGAVMTLPSDQLSSLYRFFNSTD
jgi:hypothetical protein